jgi:hypothetical protein
VADLSLPTRPASNGDQSRGQIILVAAFALAVAFVALALVTNSAIFAENLASRGETSGAADAARYQYEVRQDIGRAMEYVNRYNNSDHATAQSALVMSARNQSGKLADQRAVHSRVTTVDGVAVSQQGTIIRQTTDGSFTNDVGANGWFLAKNVDQTRAFTITVSDKTSLNPPGGSPFTVYVEEHDPSSSTSWEMSLGYDSGGDDIVLEVDYPGAGTDTCELSNPNGPVTVDVTGARLNGTYCGALENDGATPTHYAAGLSTPYNISYQDGGAIDGTYSLVVDNSTLGVTGGQQANYDGASNTNVAAAVYAAEVDLQYRTESLTYESTIRVAPGEPE